MANHGDDIEFEFKLQTNHGLRSGSHSGTETLQSWQFTDFVEELIKEQPNIKIYGIDLSVDMNTDCDHLWRDNELCKIAEHMISSLDNYQSLEDIKIWCNPSNVADETLERLREIIQITQNLKSVTINGPQTDIYDEELIKTVILSKQNRLFHVEIDGVGLCYDIETNLDELPLGIIENNNKSELFDEELQAIEERNLIPWLLYQKAYNLNRYYHQVHAVVVEKTELTLDLVNCVVNEYLKDEITIHIDTTSLTCSWEENNDWTEYAKHLNGKCEDIRVQYLDEEYQIAIEF